MWLLVIFGLAFCVCLVQRVPTHIAIKERILEKNKEGNDDSNG